MPNTMRPILTAKFQPVCYNLRRPRQQPKYVPLSVAEAANYVLIKAQLGDRPLPDYVVRSMARDRAAALAKSRSK